MKTTFSLMAAYQNFDKILQQLSPGSQPVTIQTQQHRHDLIIMNKKDYLALQETLFLASNGTLATVAQREKDASGFTNIDNLNWQAL